MAPAAVRFHPAAAQEAESTYEWYVARNPAAALRHASRQPEFHAMAANARPAVPFCPRRRQGGQFRLGGSRRIGRENAVHSAPLPRDAGGAYARRRRIQAEATSDSATTPRITTPRHPAAAV